ncbi:hypothetical protein [Bacillus subtilis]|uniref:hypothetical protein n=1 Tax=Bacillus subtilis TaxID=1423 RepID=UPI00139E2DC2|nr:hypothetical protein [Bacillus subtilis]NDJ99835.1 hypothetical protein [Bacillus subtilis subsp. subtilis]
MRYKAKVTATAIVEMEAWVHQDASGNIEIEDVEYVEEIENFKNVRPMDGR